MPLSQKAPTPQTSNISFPNTWPLRWQKKLRNSAGHNFLAWNTKWRGVLYMDMSLFCIVVDCAIFFHQFKWLFGVNSLGLSSLFKVFKRVEQISCLLNCLAPKSILLCITWPVLLGQWLFLVYVSVLLRNYTFLLG